MLVLKGLVEKTWLLWQCKPAWDTSSKALKRNLWYYLWKCHVDFCYSLTSSDVSSHNRWVLVFVQKPWRTKLNYFLHSIIFKVHMSHCINIFYKLLSSLGISHCFDKWSLYATEFAIFVLYTLSPYASLNKPHKWLTKYICFF